MGSGSIGLCATGNRRAVWRDEARETVRVCSISLAPRHKSEHLGAEGVPVARQIGPCGSRDICASPDGGSTEHIYEIYARSFQDSNGDGIGDLNGIRSRLDYLSWLGIDVFWVTPIYPSPMKDFGYDVSDYCGIDPMFGNARRFRPPD
jgi:hypothetical protein